MRLSGPNLTTSTACWTTWPVMHEQRPGSNAWCVGVMSVLLDLTAMCHSSLLVNLKNKHDNIMDSYRLWSVMWSFGVFIVLAWTNCWTSSLIVNGLWGHDNPVTVMRRNNLTSVSLDSFEDMPFSNGLDVYGNALHQLPDLYSIPSLRVLKLNGNPLEFTRPYIGWSCDRTWWHQG